MCHAFFILSIIFAKNWGGVVHMDFYNKLPITEYLAHYGIKGMKWGVRRYQNRDGSLTSAGKERYGKNKASKPKINGRTKILDLYRTYEQEIKESMFWVNAFLATHGRTQLNRDLARSAVSWKIIEDSFNL